MSEILAVQQYPPLSGLHQAVDTTDQGGFAGTGGPDQAQHRTGFQLQAYAFECCIAGRIAFVKIMNFQHDIRP